MVDFFDTAMKERRDDIRRDLDKLVRFLATDIPATERAIALRRYEALSQEANSLGLEAG